MEKPSEATAANSAATSDFAPKHPKAHEKYWSGGLRDEKRTRRQENKIELARRLGGKCQICGFNGHMSALEFDHVDPSQKSFNPGQVLDWRDIKKAWEEIRKCRLLCSNCHAIETFEKRQFCRQSRNKTFGPSWSGACVRCGTIYESVGPSRYCSSKCRHADKNNRACAEYRNGKRERVEVSEKRCSGCQEIRPAQSFYANKSAKDGLYAYCKECFLGKYSRKRAS